MTTSDVEGGREPQIGAGLGLFCHFHGGWIDFMCEHLKLAALAAPTSSVPEIKEEGEAAGLRKQIEQLRAGNRALKRRRREWTAEKVGLVARLRELEARLGLPAPRTNREGGQQEARCECCEFASDGRDCICAHPEVKVERRLARSHGEGDEARREAAREALVECLTELIDCRERWDAAGFVGTPDHINDLLDSVRARAIPGIEWKTDHPDNDYIESVALSAPPHLLQDEQWREADVGALAEQLSEAWAAAQQKPHGYAFSDERNMWNKVARCAIAHVRSLGLARW